MRRHRFSRPGREFSFIFQNIRRDFVIIFQGLPGVGPKGFHPFVQIIRNSSFIRLEIQLALVNDAEEDIFKVKPVAAKHRLAIDRTQHAKLIENKFFEGIIFHSLQPDKGDIRRELPKPINRKDAKDAEL